MSDEYLDKIRALKRGREPFASAIVVHREEPSSGKSGDKALINSSGELFGWIGGGCVQTIVCKEALDAIDSGKPRLVKIGQSLPSASHLSDIKEYKMTCHSEGAVEVFIEPYIPSPHLVIIGKTAIARALARLAHAAGYKVSAVAPDANPPSFEHADEIVHSLRLDSIQLSPRSAILVATQGESDEPALELALQTSAYYLGFVASRKKKEAVWSYLMDQGIKKEQLDRIYSPAGIDIHAKRPEEVAVSILAQIIQVKSDPGSSNPVSGRNAIISQYYINPVCGIPVDKNNPKYIIEYQGEKVYFCCDGCKESFEKDPAKYMTTTTA